MYSKVDYTEDHGDLLQLSHVKGYCQTVVLV